MRSAIVFANRARALSFFVWRHATATSEKNRNGYRFPSCLNRHLNRNAYEKTTSLKCLSNHEFKWKLSAKNSAPFSSMFLYIVPHKQNDIILFCILFPTNKMTSFFFVYCPPQTKWHHSFTHMCWILVLRFENNHCDIRFLNHAWQCIKLPVGNPKATWYTLQQEMKPTNVFYSQD